MDANVTLERLNGRKVRDRITGFTGTVTGVLFYLSGCNQALVAPEMDKDGKVPDPNWFDVQRLEIVAGVEPIVLDNSETPGCDRAPPVR